MIGQALAQGIERTGADIAIDHADRRQGDAGQGGFVSTVHELSCQIAGGAVANTGVPSDRKTGIVIREGIQGLQWERALAG